MSASHDRKRVTYQALADRILTGPGTTSAAHRASAFASAGIAPAVDPLLTKVANRPTHITDTDYAAAKAAGFTEDQLFELVIAAAAGRSARMYNSGLAALAEATGPDEAAEDDGEAG